jgi:hypothetical protein
VGVIIGKGSGEYLPRRGDLLRWIVDYKLFAADDKGNAWPHNPVYEYGVVIEVSHTDPLAVIMFGMTIMTQIVAHVAEDNLELVSPAPIRLLIPGRPPP